jgi:hypothetical protein
MLGQILPARSIRALGASGKSEFERKTDTMKHIVATLLLATITSSIPTIEIGLAKVTSAVELETVEMGEQQKQATNTSNVVRVEYVVANEQPPMNDTRWQPLTSGMGVEREIPNVKAQQRFWVRATAGTTGGDSAHWVVYGPLRGENQMVEVIPIGEMSTPEVIQFATERNKEKGWKCCRVKVRIRVVSKKPRIEVRNPTSDITVRWRGPIPSVTVRGPDVVISDLPRLPSIDSPIPVDGSVPNVGMQCDVEDGDARLSVQNGESHAVEVWVNWKGTVTGPIRIEARTMRSLGKTGYPNCDAAKENIYITKSQSAG